MEADDLRAHDVAKAISDPKGDRLIGDRLHALEAERVMQRALELEAEALDEPHLITTDQLERIAREIGVDPSFVHQALGEIRLEPEKLGRFAQWALAGDLVETSPVTGLSRADLDASINKWMTQNEGLTQSRILPDGVTWDVDRRWRARMLARSLSGSNRISRVAAGDVTHRVHTVAEEEHVLALQSEGRLPLLFARLTLAFGVGLGAVLLFGAVLSGDVLAGLGTFALLTVGSAIAAVGGARWWAGAIRRALRRSLSGLVQAAKPKRRRWFARRRASD